MSIFLCLQFAQRKFDKVGDSVSVSVSVNSFYTQLKIGTNNLQIISDVVKISCHCKYFRTL